MKYLTIPIFIIASILLATVTIASIYIVQPIKAQVCPPEFTSGTCNSQLAGPGFGGIVSGLAKGNGLQDLQASGCSFNKFPTAHHAHNVCN